MKKLFYLILMWSRLSYADAEAQTLQKGERMPNYTFKVSIGDSVFQSSLSDYEDRFIIIDFWGKYCLDCVAAMPKLLQLQDKYKGQLLILLVTTDSEQDIKKLFTKFNSKAKPNQWIDAAKKLSIVSNDTFFSRLFPFKVLPTNVWINKSRKFHSMSYSTSVTSDNITRWINGKPMELDEMVIRDIDPYDPFSMVAKNKELQTGIRSYSMLLNRIEYGMGASAWVTNIVDSIAGRDIGITCLNSSLTELYKIAYRNALKLGHIIPDYRIIWKTSRRFDLIPPPQYPPSSEKSLFYKWATKNTFCYALKIDSNLGQDLYRVMQKDLDRSFGLNSSIRKINVKCRILKTISGSNTNHLVYHDGNTSIRSGNYINTGKELVIENLPFEQLYLSITNVGEVQKWAMPVINEVKYTGNVNIKLSWNTDLSKISLKKLNAELIKYGLTIAEEYRLLEMLVIRELNN